MESKMTAQRNTKYDGSSEQFCSDRVNGDNQERVDATVKFLREKTSVKPDVLIILGTGLGNLAECVQQPEVFDYKDIPNFLSSTTPGHAGRLIFGKIGGKFIACMQGRFHMHEGYPVWKTVFPIRVMRSLGAKLLIATNASGGLNANFRTGDLMIIKDHIFLPGLIGLGPLLGCRDERLGPRFTALSDAYDPNIRQQAWEVARGLGMTSYMHEGIYVMQSGPCYETVAECWWMKSMGADVTGMSTVPEIITARHAGMKAFAISLVTNMCVMDYTTQDKAHHEEVLEIGRQRSQDLCKFFQTFITGLKID